MRLAGRRCLLSAFGSAFSYTLSPSNLHSAFLVVVTSDLSLPNIAFFPLPLSSTLSLVQAQFILSTIETCTLRTGVEV